MSLTFRDILAMAAHFEKEGDYEGSIKVLKKGMEDLESETSEEVRIPVKLATYSV